MNTPLSFELLLYRAIRTSVIECARETTKPNKLESERACERARAKKRMLCWLWNGAALEAEEENRRTTKSMSSTLLSESSLGVALWNCGITRYREEAKIGLRSRYLLDLFSISLLLFCCLLLDARERERETLRYQLSVD